MDSQSAVRIVIGGDFAPCGRYGKLITSGVDNIFESAMPIFDAADFTLFNLELPVCGATQALSKWGPSMRVATDTLQALTTAGIDAVSLANNHIFDFGNEGLAQTIAALKDRGIQYTGAGFDRGSAETPLRIEIRGRQISLFSFAEREFNVCEQGQSGAALLDPVRIAPLLVRERRNADAIIVCIHGGTEFFAFPSPGFRQMCQFMIDMGADAVIGHHPHVPGPYEIYRGKPIAYSLGNLIFDARVPPPAWDEGYLAGLDLTFGDDGLDGVRLELVPYHQAVSHGGLKLMEGGARSGFLSRIAQMRDRLENRPQEWLECWDDFVDQKQTQAFIDIASPVRFRGFRRLAAWRFIENLIVPPSRQRHRLNLLRCPSHQELVARAFERKIAADDSRSDPGKARN